jgi:hypothetical protein
MKLRLKEDVMVSLIFSPYSRLLSLLINCHGQKWA